MAHHPALPPPSGDRALKRIAATWTPRVSMSDDAHVEQPHLARIVDRLAIRGVTMASDVLCRSWLDIAHLADVDRTTAKLLQTEVAQAICPRPQCALDIVKGKRITIPTQIPTLDDSLRGGIHVGHVTELVGPAGAGKTQFCLSLAATAAAPATHNGLETGVLYVDTERRFSASRVLEIARTRLNVTDHQDATSLADRIAVVRTENIEDLRSRVAWLQTSLGAVEGGVRLVVIDSVAAMARCSSKNDAGIPDTETLGVLAASLKRLADVFGVAVVVTNQVASRATSSARVGACDDEDIVAALGIQWAHGVNVRVAMDFQGALAEQRACTAARGLELHRGRQRWLEVAKCPHAHCARVAYRVTERGVEEIV